jgi:phosphoribosylanthranilate isomerase
LRNPQEIIAQQKYCQTNTIQLVDSQQIGTYKVLRAELRNVQIIQVIHVLDDISISEALAVAKYVDMLLLDSGNSILETKELGGTGRMHNWEISREIVNHVDVPVFLAGGLTPDNVAKAVERVKPFGVDVCTGVRTDGNLDYEKVKLFIDAVNK